MAPNETKHIDAAHASALKVFATQISNADVILENWRNEGARMIRESAEKIASLESSLELLDALEQERRARDTRTELHHAVTAHHGIVDAARNIVKRAVIEHAQAYAAAGVAMNAALAEAMATAVPTAVAGGATA
jgi:hypothetical protein